MILRGRMIDGGKGILVKAWDMYLDNKNIMSDDEVKDCFIKGINYEWCYKTSELESLNPTIPLSKLEYELLKYWINHGYQYIARDDDKVLFAYNTKPDKMQYEWETPEWAKRINFDDLFSFVKWKDEEPYPITYILDNCEVDENA